MVFGVRLILNASLEKFLHVERCLIMLETVKGGRGDQS